MIRQDELLTRRVFAEGLLREVGKNALDAFIRRDFQTATKGPQDFVTEVDQNVEAFLSARLAEAFPNDSIFGEERGGRVGSATWFLDPIDGTANFMRGIPYWCLSAGLVIGGKAVVGVVYDPCQDEMFSAHLDGGAYLNGKRIRVSTTEQLASTIVAVGFNFHSSVGRHGGGISALLDAGAVYRMPGAGALALAHVAAGRMDAFWEEHIMPWDVAAGLALVREAGGFTSGYGEDGQWEGHKPLLAGSPVITGKFIEEGFFENPFGPALHAAHVPSPKVR